MKTLTLPELNSILKRQCTFQLNDGFVQFLPDDINRTEVNHVLFFNIKASPYETGIGNSKTVIEQNWFLSGELIVKTNFGLSKNKYFQFEIIDLEDTRQKLLIETQFILPIFYDLMRKGKDFHLLLLISTLGLKDNDEMKKSYEAYCQTLMQNHNCEHSKEYYDNKFKHKSREEEDLIIRARLLLKKGVAIKNLEAIEIYNKVIDMNPKNPYAYFNRACARMSWKNYVLKNNPDLLVVEKVESEKANNDFQTAFDLHPYLCISYEKLKHSGYFNKLRSE